MKSVNIFSQLYKIKKLSQTSLSFCTIVFIASLMMLSAGFPSKAEAGSRKTLIIAKDIESVLETGVSEAEAIMNYKPLLKYLEKVTGRKVEIYPVTEQAAVTEALRAGKADMSSFSPYRYVLATKRVDMEPIAFKGDLETRELSFYYSYILTSPKSGINSMADIKTNSHDLTFAFQDPASTSGTFIPKINLIKNGINPDTDFREVTTGNEDLVVAMAVKTGKSDLCACSDSFWTRMTSNGTIKDGDLKIIFKSDPILKTIVGVRKGLDPELKQVIQKAYVEMADKDMDALMSAMGSSWSSGVLFAYIPPTEEIKEKLAEYTKIAKANGL